MQDDRQKRGPWTIQSTRDVYNDPWLRVQRDEVIRPDGLPGSYATVHLRSGVCVIAIDDLGQVHLTKEFHYAVGRVTIEGVSGGIEDGETPESTAERELAEELGLQATRWTRICRVDPFTAAIHSTVDLFLAEGLSTCSRAPEGTELIEHVTLPFDQAVAMVGSGEISHSPSCVALLMIALKRAAVK